MTFCKPVITDKICVVSDTSYELGINWNKTCTFCAGTGILVDDMNPSPKSTFLYRIYYITLSVFCQRITGTKGAGFVPIYS